MDDRPEPCIRGGGEAGSQKVPTGGKGIILRKTRGKNQEKALGRSGTGKCTTVGEKLSKAVGALGFLEKKRGESLIE